MPAGRSTEQLAHPAHQPVRAGRDGGRERAAGVVTSGVGGRGGPGLPRAGGRGAQAHGPHPTESGSGPDRKLGTAGSRVRE
ncbi:hypothetical protein ACFFX0_17010 [Citricoccus parietis]|uniref:Uncharacterized protein n=1 Tax=Citricoccus parietis TaxID=592307 RepID=A0ABV5G1J6_9MICC